MTAERVAALQATRPPKGARLLRGTVSAVSPLTVQLAGGAAVAGIPVPGATYTVGDAVVVLWQEPGVGPVFQVAPPAAAVAPVTTGAFTYSGTAANWDTATRMTSLTRTGPHGLLNLQATVGATPPTAGSVILTIGATPSGFRPARVVDADVVLFNGGFNNQRATLDLGIDGRLVLQSSTITIPANAGLFAAIPFPLV